MSGKALTTPYTERELALRYARQDVRIVEAALARAIQDVGWRRGELTSAEDNAAKVARVLDQKRAELAAMEAGA